MFVRRLVYALALFDKAARPDLYPLVLRTIL